MRALELTDFAALQRTTEIKADTWTYRNMMLLLWSSVGTDGYKEEVAVPEAVAFWR